MIDIVDSMIAWGKTKNTNPNYYSIDFNPDLKIKCKNDSYKLKKLICLKKFLL